VGEIQYICLDILDMKKVDENGRTCELCLHSYASECIVGPLCDRTERQATFTACRIVLCARLFGFLDFNTSHMIWEQH
jgi:hypothetical protein